MKTLEQEADNQYLNINPSLKTVYWLGGVICIILIVYSILTMLIMVLIGTPPETVTECFNMLNNNKLLGLLRLDILTVFIMPLYYILFYSIYTAIKKINHEMAMISALLIFAGLTLFLAAPSVFSYLHLSDKFAAAAAEIEKNRLISAGEAILASDIWHGTGARIGGILMQTGALLISFIMLKNKVFNKATAFTGILTFGFDLLHKIFVLFIPAAGVIFMAIAGPLYLLWFPLIGLRLFRLSKYCKNQ